MEADNASAQEKKENPTETETPMEEEPNPKDEVEKLADDKVVPPNQQATGSTSESSVVETAGAVNTAAHIQTQYANATIDRFQEMYLRVSTTPGCESLCTRVLEDCPDEEDLIPPVVNITLEQLMCPGWYRSLCASPYCDGDV